MKTNVFTLTLAMIITCSAYAQKTYLKITNSEIGEDVIMYPPGTKFELKTKEGYIIFKNSGDEGRIEIAEKHTLFVYPSWKDSPDVFVLTDGKVEKVFTKTYSSSHNQNEPISYNGVTAEKELTESKVVQGKQNLKFTLSNGIVFTYEDGKYDASLKGEALKIKGKYLIYSDLGILKLSFNPSNGVVWWVFEKNN